MSEELTTFGNVILSHEEQPDEEWRILPSWDGYYEASSWGRIRSLQRIVPHARFGEYRVSSKILSQWISTDGYCIVKMSKENVSSPHLVSRLVASAHIPNPYNLPQVNHVNGIKTCNYKWNLEWTDESGNTLHAYATGLIDASKQGKKGADCHFAKLNDEDVKLIRKLKSDGIDRHTIIETFSIGKSQYYNIVSGKQWAHI